MGLNGISNLPTGNAFHHLSIEHVDERERETKRVSGVWAITAISC